MREAPCALVVDDAQAARHRVAVLLQLAGWRVYEAVGAHDALRAAAQLAPDLVVTDLRMRGGNGIDLVQALRRSGSRARFLFLATRPTARDRAQAAAVGVPCLAKPVDPRELVRFLREPRTVPAAQSPVYVPAQRWDVEHDEVQLEWLREQYVTELPRRLALLAEHVREGDTDAVAAAARQLAGASGQVGRREVESICRLIAADAGRGLISRSRLVELLAAAGTSAIAAG
jgi:DNA-binding response OmpR family regulator